MHKTSLNDFSLWDRYSTSQLQARLSARVHYFPHAKIGQYILHGGLPGICFLRHAKHQTAAFKSLIETILQRDIRLLIETTVPYTRLLDLLKFLASRQGLPLNEKEASRATNISTPTVSKLMDAFESLFLIRRFRGNGDRVGDVVYFEDQGIASYLSSSQVLGTEHRFAFSQLFAAAHYAHMNDMVMNYFETKGGAHVPFLFSFGSRRVAFMIHRGESLDRSTSRTLSSLRDRFPDITAYLVS
jgi:predicted AAA+ superfamily ATPase